MPIVVTGAAGFVGRALVAALLRLGDVPVVATDLSLGALTAKARLRLVAGDLADWETLTDIFAGGVSALIHLATVPGGAAEANPTLAKRVNIDATCALIDAAAKAGARPRVVYASTIAVLGDPLPVEGVDDATPLAPRMIYGAQKAMIETWIAAKTRRGEIDGVSLRLPGIVARPRGAAGLKSAFMSDVFHALAAGEEFVSPVSPEARMWLTSLDQAMENLLHAATLDSAILPASRAVTLPALRVRMGDLVNEIAAATAHRDRLVSYRPDAALEAGFGAQPALLTPAADRAGFHHDGVLRVLVERALASARAED